MRLATEPRRKTKGAAPPRLTVHGDPPAHQGHQPGCNRQAQPCAAVLPRGGGVLLLESPEDRLLLLGRNADAGVGDREVQADFPVGHGIAGDFDPHDHLALLGELDGVTNQVEQRLAQPAGVADQGIGHARLHVADQFQSFLVAL